MKKFKAAATIFLWTALAGASRADDNAALRAANETLSAAVAQARALGAQSAAALPPAAPAASDYCLGVLKWSSGGLPSNWYVIDCGEGSVVKTKARTGFRSGKAEDLAMADLKSMMAAKNYLGLGSFKPYLQISHDTQKFSHLFRRAQAPAVAAASLCLASIGQHSWDSLPISYVLDCTGQPLIQVYNLDKQGEITGITRYMKDKGYAPAAVFSFRDEKIYPGTVVLFQKP